MSSKNFDKIYKRFLKDKERKSKKHKRKLNESEKREKIETEIIKTEMGRAGFKFNYENGYVFNFEKNGYTVNFVNQTDRLCVSFYKTIKTKEESKIFRDWESRSMMYEHDDVVPQLAKDFVSYFLYKHKIFDGNTHSACIDLIKFFNNNYKLGGIYD